jgi:FkbM family methyltransferase
MADHVYDTEYAMREFTIAGEVQIMERLKEFQLTRIFDVGANIGEWTKMVQQTQPDADIHCFEPVPEVYHRLTTAVHGPNVMTNPFGLSSECQIIDMLFDRDNDRLTTPCLELQRELPQLRRLIMLSGAEYCSTREIEHIDFLKIDTEGHEFKVIKGFEEMLKTNPIPIIQFEYGFANVLTKDLLIDFYKFLKPLGYNIGLQHPNGVYFREYTLTHENFMGPNYVAVHGDYPQFMNAVQANVE